MKKSIILCLLSLVWFALPAAGAENRRGSSLMHDIAVRDNYTFLNTPADVMWFVELGILVPLPGNYNYKLSDASFPYVRPDVKLFVERLSLEYRWSCGERLVVTSATRPKSRQPRNAAKLSVHPAGIGLDLRIPERTECRVWLERELEKLMQEGVLVVIREANPPHYHLGVFPKEYREYLDAKEEKMCAGHSSGALDGIFLGSLPRSSRMNTAPKGGLLARW